MTDAGSTRQQRTQDRNAYRSRRVQLIALAVAAVLVVTTAVIAFVRNSNDAAAGGAELDHPAQLTAYLAAVTTPVSAVTSYDYRRLDDSFAAGLAVSTGSYQRAYRSSFAALRSGATNDQVTQTFEQLRAGVGTISDGGKQAQVLVFGTEARTSTGGSSSEDVTLRVTLVRRGNTYLISDLAEDASAGLPPANDGLRAAAEAGRSEVININSYRRAHFDADLAVALDGAAGTLRGQLRAQAGSTRAALTKGGYDLSGAVTAVAVERVTTKEVTLLMAATGIRIASDGSRSSIGSVRFEVVVDLIGGTWQTTQVTPVRGS